MQASTKSLLMLLSMLVLGAGLGAAGTVALGGSPAGPQGPPEGGFVAHMERTIQPVDDAQRAAIMPILEATDRDNRAEVDRSQAAMRNHLDSMEVALAPLLRPEQRERLSLLIQQLDRPPGPPGRPPPGR